MSKQLQSCPLTVISRILSLEMASKNKNGVYPESFINFPIYLTLIYWIPIVSQEPY